jgi:Type II secretion system (T2SS), protein M subtype b
MTGPGAVARKCLALALFGLGLLPVLLAGTWFRGTYRDGEEERQVLLERFDRTRAIAAYVADAEGAPDADAAHKLFIAAGTPAVIAAELQARLRGIAAENGVDVLQASDLKADEQDGLARLGIRLEMSGPAAGIHAVLEQIDLSVPWLFAGNLLIRSGYADGQGQQFEPPLSIALDVYGVMLAESGGAPP